MKCKSCKNKIPDGSIFCMYCGEKQIKGRQEKKEIPVPKPKQLPSGTWFAQLMVDGERVPISAPTEKEYFAKARAVKAGLIEQAKLAPKCTLREAMRQYIDSVDGVFPPSTIRGYEVIYRNRCKLYMDDDISSIDFQQLIRDEAKQYSPHTVSNTWDLIRQTLKYKKIAIPEISKPQIAPTEEDFLDYEQIGIFLKAIRGDRIELGAILALHSLRQSELLDLYTSDIKDAHIVVHGATVQDKNNNYVHKDSNKNSSSWREVPILIPRLYELLPEDGKLVTVPPNTMMKRIKKICRDNGLPECSLHDLRRSFASLAYHLNWKEKTTMLVGGWKTMKTVHAVYEKLSAKDQQKDIQKMQRFYSKITNEFTNKACIP